MPPEIADELCKSHRLTVLDGDIVLPGMGLSGPEQDLIRKNAQIVIHAASSINLAKGLPSLVPTVIRASETVARFALTCKLLDRFVYVSSAYANSHLSPRNVAADVEIKEEFYAPRKGSTATSEWDEVQQNGTSQAYEAEDFPWAYAYAKNLTERLLSHLFVYHGVEHKLLILRPSVIGPAQKYPFPGYSLPMSTPTTILAAALALTPSWTFRAASRFTSPDDHINLDEVPVDVVVDRLISHLAIGSVGCVHAVSGKRARIHIREWQQSAMKLRQIPWTLHPEWVVEDWKSARQHQISRFYIILGTSFSFLEDRTVTLSTTLSTEELSDLQLFTSVHRDNRLQERTEQIRFVMDHFASKSWLVFLIVWIFYRNFGKVTSKKSI